MPLTTAEAAARLGVSRGRVLHLIRDKRLPATKHGRDWVIRENDLEQLRRLPVGRPSKARGVKA